MLIAGVTLSLVMIGSCEIACAAKIKIHLTNNKSNLFIICHLIS